MHNHIRLIAFPCLIFIVLMSISSGVYAFAWSADCGGHAQHWSGSTTLIRISTTSFPQGGAYQRLIAKALDKWTAQKGSRFSYTIGADTDGTHRFRNGVNEVFWEKAGPTGFVGWTKKKYRCRWTFGWRWRIEESDTCFNWDFNYRLYNGDPSVELGGSSYNFEAVALHEFGHALGLGHEDRVLATMNHKTPWGGVVGSSQYRQLTPYGDDLQGLRFLYGNNETETDVIPIPFRSNLRGSVTSLRVTPTRVPRGGTLTMEYGISNLSTHDIRVDVGFYLSTNRYISTYDTYLGANYGITGGPGATTIVPHTRTLKVPATVLPETYYIGYLVDFNNKLTETFENNNGQDLAPVITIY